LQRDKAFPRVQLKALLRTAALLVEKNTTKRDPYSEEKVPKAILSLSMAYHFFSKICGFHFHGCGSVSAIWPQASKPKNL
jgi:hypothetical protein